MKALGGRFLTTDLNGIRWSWTIVISKPPRPAAHIWYLGHWRFYLNKFYLPLGITWGRIPWNCKGKDYDVRLKKILTKHP